MALPLREIGERIQLVRSSLGVSQRQLADALGVNVATVDHIESGSLDPLPGDYVLITARLLRTDFRYFISYDVDDVEKETDQIFRALSDPTPADLFAIRKFISFSTSENELEDMLGIESRPLPPKYPQSTSLDKLHKDQGRRAARQERSRLQLGNAPISNVFELIRSQSVRFYRHHLKDSQLSGVTVLHPRSGVCVLINYVDDLYRQFFSAAHEYAHVLFDRAEIAASGCVVSYRYTAKDLIEIRANAFAAEFLLPSTAIARYVQPKTSEALLDTILTIARDYKVNTETVAIRLKDLGWMTQRTLTSFQNERPAVIPKRDKIDPDVPVHATPNQQERWSAALKEGVSTYFLELLRKALTENKVTFGRFAEMLAMTPEQAMDFVAETGLAI